MQSGGISILVRYLAYVMIAAAISSCTVPGMRLNVTAVGNDEPVFNNGTDASNVDVFAINSVTIQRLRDEKAATERRPDEDPAHISSTAIENYKVGPQDVLRVTVWDHPELNNPSGTTTGEAVGRIVNVDGTMFYPYVGTIQVSGKSTDEIRKYIRSALERVIRDPQVEVNVQTYRSQKIFLTGDLKSPGIVFLTDAPITVSEAIAQAGGPNPDADLRHVIVTRGSHKMIVDAYEELAQGDFSKEGVLHSGDVVTLPEGRGNKIFVMGEIVKQGSLPFPAGKYSLTDALGDSGGVIQFSSNPAQVYVIRMEGNRPVIFHLNARNPDALVMADDFELHSRDVIYVEAAEVSRIGRIISQVLPAATALATGRTLAQ